MNDLSQPKDFTFEYEGSTRTSSSFGKYIPLFMANLERHAPRDGGRFLEWGGGMSTLALYDFAQPTKPKKMLTVDSNDRWTVAITDNIKRVFGGIGPWCEIKFMDMTGGTATMVDPGLNYSTYPLSKKELFDFIYIDGRRRMECTLVAALLSHAGTKILYHDYRRPRYQLNHFLFETVDEDEQFRVMKPRVETLALQDKSAALIRAYLQSAAATEEHFSILIARNKAAAQKK